jgi:hypothetical protein
VSFFASLYTNLSTVIDGVQREKCYSSAHNTHSALIVGEEKAGVMDHDAGAAKSRLYAAD